MNGINEAEVLFLLEQAADDAFPRLVEQTQLGEMGCDLGLVECGAGENFAINREGNRRGCRQCSRGRLPL